MVIDETQRNHKKFSLTLDLGSWTELISTGHKLVRQRLEGLGLRLAVLRTVSLHTRVRWGSVREGGDKGRGGEDQDDHTLGKHFLSFSLIG